MNVKDEFESILSITENVQIRPSLESIRHVKDCT